MLHHAIDISGTIVLRLQRHLQIQRIYYNKLKNIVVQSLRVYSDVECENCNAYKWENILMQLVKWKSSSSTWFKNINVLKYLML